MGTYKPAVVLLIVTVIAGGILGGINAVAKEPIRIQEEKTLKEAMGAIYPDATDFAAVDSLEDSNVLSCYEAWQEDSKIGYILETISKGYGGDVTILTGVNLDGTVAGVRITDHSETPGLGANAEKENFISQYTNKTNGITVVKTAPRDNEIEAITSATITSNAVTYGVNTALTCCFTYLGVDES